MARWQAFGRLIAGHMIYIVPFCLAGGIFLPGVFSRLNPVVPALFALMTFQGSLTSGFDDLLACLRRPLPLIVALLVTSVAMPAVACALGQAIFRDPQTTCGLVLEYSVPIGVVSIMWVGLFEGDVTLGLATLMASTLLSPLSIPLTLSVLVGATVSMDPLAMMQEMLLMIALPAVAGMAVNQLSRGWGGEVLSPALSPACRVILVLIIAANSTGISDYMLHLSPRLLGIMLFVGCFASAGFVVGLLLGKLMGLGRPQAVTLTFDCGLRNISAGAVIAERFFGPAVMFPVMMGTLFQQFLAAAFGSLLGRRFGGEGEPSPEA